MGGHAHLGELTKKMRQHIGRYAATLVRDENHRVETITRGQHTDR